MEKESVRYPRYFLLLAVCAALLTVRVVYLFLADAQRFPVNTVQVAATYQQVSRVQLEEVLSPYLHYSFFLLPHRALQADLLKLRWIKQVEIKRRWPDLLKITLIEKLPVARWEEEFITEDGQLLPANTEQIESALPILSGPVAQQKQVLQNYQKFSMLLSRCGLTIAVVRWRDNLSWELSLTNGVLVHLGKQGVERRLERLCKAWPSVFSDKPEQVASIDLRYARGMAVQWKQQMGT